MPWGRQASATLWPASMPLRMLIICSSLNLVLRMMSSPRSVILRENSHYFCTSFRGGGQLDTAARPRVTERTYGGYKTLLERYVNPSVVAGSKLSDVRPLNTQLLYSDMLQRG